jgi:hypothetical protein
MKGSELAILSSRHAIHNRSPIVVPCAPTKLLSAIFSREDKPVRETIPGGVRCPEYRVWLKLNHTESVTSSGGLRVSSSSSDTVLSDILFFAKAS